VPLAAGPRSEPGSGIAVVKLGEERLDRRYRDRATRLRPLREVRTKIKQERSPLLIFQHRASLPLTSIPNVPQVARFVKPP